MSIANEVDGILGDLESLSLDEIQKASLLKRKDRKYIFRRKIRQQLLVKTPKK